jgi:hypothetical protein
MIFKKKEEKKEPIEKISDTRRAILNEINTLMMLHNLNESNLRLRKIDNGEYETTKAFIMQRCDELERSLAFNDMLGDPMDAIERMFDGPTENTTQGD